MLLIFVLHLLLLHVGFSSPWTEQDEARRIQQIMEEERKAWELETRSQGSSARQSSGSGSRPSYPVATPPPPTPEPQTEHWCYHCTSPIGHLSDSMKKTIKDFLKLRRTSYPREVSTPECITARNYSMLHKQTCKHRYCQTVALIDHNEGASFVLRGCAENFGAIDVKHLESQRENHCSKLHERLDISECICKTRKYCFANERHSSTSLPSSLLALTLLTILRL